jgi:hypothetical protein
MSKVEFVLPRLHARQLPRLVLSSFLFFVSLFVLSPAYIAL